MTAVPMKGSTIEVHGDVGTPQLGAVDFAYAPPPGAALKASLFEPPAGRAAPGVPLGRQADATLLALEGKGLSAGEAEALEKQVAGNPDDVAARTRLLGYYFRARADGAKLPHVLWLIENAPESEVLGLPFAEMDKRIDPDGYQRGKTAWSAALAKQPQNLKLLANASRYFLLYDPELARETLERGRSLDGGNAEWSSALGESMDAAGEGARGGGGRRRGGQGARVLRGGLPADDGDAKGSGRLSGQRSRRSRPATARKRRSTPVCCWRTRGAAGTGGTTSTRETSSSADWRCRQRTSRRPSAGSSRPGALPVRRSSPPSGRTWRSPGTCSRGVSGTRSCSTSISARSSGAAAGRSCRTGRRPSRKTAPEFGANLVY